MTRWRKRIGAEEIELLLAETIRLALETGAVNERQLGRITVDTTVQTKAVAHPTDSHLILRATEWLNRIAKRQRVKLRQSFSRVMVRARREAARLMHSRGHRQGLRWVGKMRTWLGRLIRDIRRRTEGKPELEAAFQTALERAGKLLAQAPTEKGKLYAIHAPEVECIGKGKARSRYEFGVKASFATTNARCEGGQFVLGARTLPGNPYDGHSLAAQIAQTERLTGRRVKRAYADRGYRGHGVEREGLEVILSHTRGIASPTIRREMRPLGAIEPVIGYMKVDSLLFEATLPAPTATRSTRCSAPRATTCASSPAGWHFFGSVSWRAPCGSGRSWGRCDRIRWSCEGHRGRKSRVTRRGVSTTKVAQNSATSHCRRLRLACGQCVPGSRPRWPPHQQAGYRFAWSDCVVCFTSCTAHEAAARPPPALQSRNWR
jgi:IS5 family transposase